MTKRGAVLILAMAALAASGCTKEEMGTVIGAGTGAVIGHEVGGHGGGAVVGTMLGTLAGAWVGREVGKSLDKADQLAMERTTQDALEKTPSGKTQTWTNPDSGHSGTVTPQPSFQNKQGENCREYQQTVKIGGKTETAYGTACRQPDGSWKISNS